MTYRDIFTRLQTDLSKFNPNELIVVTYDQSRHTLQFNQMNHVVIATYISPFFLPKKNFKIGVLTPDGYNKLMYALQQLLQNQLIDDLVYIPNIGELKTGWYRSFGNKLPIPEQVIELKYVNVTHRLIVWFLCTKFNNNSKILYKLATQNKKVTGD